VPSRRRCGPDYNGCLAAELRPQHRGRGWKARTLLVSMEPRSSETFATTNPLVTPGSRVAIYRTACGNPDVRWRGKRAPGLWTGFCDANASHAARLSRGRSAAPRPHSTPVPRRPAARGFRVRDLSSDRVRCGHELGGRGGHVHSGGCSDLLVRMASAGHSVATEIVLAQAHHRRFPASFSGGNYWQPNASGWSQRHSLQSSCNERLRSTRTSVATGCRRQGASRISRGDGRVATRHELLRRFLRRLTCPAGLGNGLGLQPS
jgi:hypothetical protein